MASSIEFPEPGSPPTSRTHHDVWALPDATWLKVARDRSPIAADQITREVAVTRALGRTITAGMAWDGRPAFLTRDLGSPVRGPLTPELVAVLLAQLEGYGRVMVPSGVLPAGATWSGRAQGKIIDRLTDSRDAATRDWCLARADTDCGVLRGSSLAHTDAHLGNWVVDPAGVCHLLDWESAMVSVPAVDRAVMFHACALNGSPVGARAVLDSGPVDEAFVSTWRIKSAVAVSWLVWDARRRGVNPGGVLPGRWDALAWGDRWLNTGH